MPHEVERDSSAEKKREWGIKETKGEFKMRRAVRRLKCCAEKKSDRSCKDYGDEGGVSYLEANLFQESDENTWDYWVKDYQL